MLNLAASANRPELTVTRRPRIAVVATGDELVPPGSTLGPDQIIASNSYGLIPLLAPYADEVIDLGIVPDDTKKIEDALLSAFDQGIDMLVTTGGASVGERDYVQEVLRDLGVELDFWKLRMRPGKPLMFGTRGKTLVFGLPGNPVSGARHLDDHHQARPAGHDRLCRPILAAHRRPDAEGPAGQRPAPPLHARYPQPQRYRLPAGRSDLRDRFQPLRARSRSPTR